MQNFHFYSRLPVDQIEQDAIQLRIPKKINDENKICDIYKLGLNMPSYFGGNWDALADCLRDLDFINEKNVIVIHEDLPFEFKRGDKQIYIRILFAVAKHWQEYPEHKFYVYFPESCKKEVVDFLNILG